MHLEGQPGARQEVTEELGSTDMGSSRSACRADQPPTYRYRLDADHVVRSAQPRPGMPTMPCGLSSFTQAAGPTCPVPCEHLGVLLGC